MHTSHRETELLIQIQECQERLAAITAERERQKPGDVMQSLIRQAAEQARWLAMYRRELVMLRGKDGSDSQQ